MFHLPNIVERTGGRIGRGGFPSSPLKNENVLENQSFFLRIVNNSADLNPVLAVKLPFGLTQKKKFIVFLNVMSVEGFDSFHFCLIYKRIGCAL